MDSQRQAPSIRRLVAAFLYAGTAIVSLALGAIYLFRASFMPYHAVALGRDWRELDHATQTLLKGLMEVAAGGWLALGVLVLLLVAFPIRRGERWARLATPTALLLFYVPTLLATLSVLHETPASPPWRGNVVACVAAVVGFLLDAPWLSDRRTDQEVGLSRNT
jgi:ABC-type Fe3+ transport system permease subunit